MKIGIVTTWFERGAAYVSKQFESVWGENHEVFIYARGGERYAIGDPNWDKGNVTWGKRSMFSTPTQINVRHLRQWIEINKIELVLFNEQHEWEPVIACSQMDVIIGAYIDYYKAETVRFFALYDFLICNTKRHLSVFEWHPQAFYIPWGTDTNLFVPNKKKVDFDKVVFFHSCGMNPLRKGTDIVLEAFQKIDRKKSSLIIHSQLNLKSIFPNKNDLITKFQKEGSLQLIEKTVSAPGLYHFGDVYVYPSRLEGIGLTIAEAISCGLPVIVTNEAPMNEFVQSFEAGRVIDVSYKEEREDDYYWPQSIASVSSLAQEMEFFINNKDHLPEFQVKARKYAIKNLDWFRNLNLFEKKLTNIRKKSNLDQKLVKDALSYDKLSFSQRIKKSLAYRKLRMYFRFIF